MTTPRITLCALVVLPLLSFGALGDLVTLDEDDKEDNGLEKFLEKHIEPFGVACVAYVDDDSKNHQLIQKLDEEAKENSSALHTLQVQTAAAVHWNEIGDEQLKLVYRRPFRELWQMTGEQAPDPDLVYPHKGKKAWNSKKVRSWLQENAWPLVNIRIMEQAYGDFPEAKYMSPISNPGGVVLIVSNLTGDREFKTQFQLYRMLRPFAEKYRGKLRFSFVERSKKTRELRQRFSVGMDFNHQDEILLIDNVKDDYPKETDKWNHFHGNPNKYRLQNVTKEAVEDFFQAYEAKTLKPYFVSREDWTYSGNPPPREIARRLTGNTFDEAVFDEEPLKSKLVVFFNDEPSDGCQDCVAVRKTWDLVAKKVQNTKKLASKLELMTIDQSMNEHSETLVAAKLAQAILVWYPPGTRKVRQRKRMQITLPRSQDPDDIVEFIAGKAEDLFEDGEL
eukprot:TRINITY_DN3180_c0_g1_i1.p2 TRINITY_DN3180_c0_g1~~TRINITY_DN3180_c0_g1_i1.p2  ORF type:complete len:463 (+),score=121.45 TRINITY_DN3180_c0_g1_i1:45-1391(+)